MISIPRFPCEGMGWNGAVRSYVDYFYELAAIG